MWLIWLSIGFLVGIFLPTKYKKPVYDWIRGIMRKGNKHLSDDMNN